MEIGKYFTSLPNLGIFIFYYLMWGQKIFGEMKTIFDLIYSGHPKCNEKEGGKVFVFFHGIFHSSIDSWLNIKITPL